MYSLSGDLTLILTTTWWLQKLGKDWWQVNKQHKSLMWRDLNSSELQVRKQLSDLDLKQVCSFGELKYQGHK
jgi:hypothetical protein